MNLYARCLATYADLLLKQKLLTAEGDVAEIIANALDKLDQEFELDL